MRVILIFGVFLGASLGLWNGCLGSKPRTDVELSASVPAGVARVRVEAGTPIRVALHSRISTRTAHPGDAWEGQLAEDVVMFRAVTRTPGPGEKARMGPAADAVIVLDRVMIPAGSHVTGVVTAALAGPSGPGALLARAVKAIDVRGRTLAISASAGQAVASFSRSRSPGGPASNADPIVLRFMVDEIVDVQ